VPIVRREEIAEVRIRKQLDAVTVSARRAVDVGDHPTPSESSAVAALRECLEAARAGNDSHARVPRGLLRDAIWRLEDLTGAK
jgi:hypothetical protein